MYGIFLGCDLFGGPATKPIKPCNITPRYIAIQYFRDSLLVISPRLSLSLSTRPSLPSPALVLLTVIRREVDVVEGHQSGALHDKLDGLWPVAAADVALPRTPALEAAGSLVGEVGGRRDVDARHAI